jgi:hypothetical protein
MQSIESKGGRLGGRQHFVGSGRRSMRALCGVPVRVRVSGSGKWDVACCGRQQLPQVTAVAAHCVARRRPRRQPPAMRPQLLASAAHACAIQAIAPGRRRPGAATVCWSHAEALAPGSEPGIDVPTADMLAAGPPNQPWWRHRRTQAQPHAQERGRQQQQQQQQQQWGERMLEREQQEQQEQQGWQPTASAALDSTVQGAAYAAAAGAQGEGRPIQLDPWTYTRSITPAVGAASALLGAAAVAYFVAPRLASKLWRGCDPAAAVTKAEISMPSVDVEAVSASVSAAAAWAPAPVQAPLPRGWWQGLVRVHYINCGGRHGVLPRLVLDPRRPGRATLVAFEDPADADYVAGCLRAGLAGGDSVAAVPPRPQVVGTTPLLVEDIAALQGAHAVDVLPRGRLRHGKHLSPEALTILLEEILAVGRSAAHNPWDGPVASAVPLPAAAVADPVALARGSIAAAPAMEVAAAAARSFVPLSTDLPDLLRRSLASLPGSMTAAAVAVAEGSGRLMVPAVQHQGPAPMGTQATAATEAVMPAEVAGSADCGATASANLRVSHQHVEAVAAPAQAVEAGAVAGVQEQPLQQEKLEATAAPQERLWAQLKAAAAAAAPPPPAGAAAATAAAAAVEVAASDASAAGPAMEETAAFVASPQLDEVPETPGVRRQCSHCPCLSLERESWLLYCLIEPP